MPLVSVGSEGANPGHQRKDQRMSDDLPSKTCETLIRIGELLTPRLEVTEPFPAEQYGDHIGRFAPAFRHHHTNYDDLLEELWDHWFHLRCTCTSNSMADERSCYNYKVAYMQINREVRMITESVRGPLREQYESERQLIQISTK